MFNLPSSIGLLHRHGDEWTPMDPVEGEEEQHSDPGSHDVERKVLSGRRIYRCRDCPEEIAIEEGGSDS